MKSSGLPPIGQRVLGGSGIVVPPMGIGTLPWGDTRFGYGKTYGRDDIASAFTACMDAGLNFFDTSENYGKGQAEQLIGDLAREDGRPVIVATKFSPASIFEPSSRFSPKSVMPTLDSSLERLGRKNLDLLQLHSPPPKRKLNGFIDALSETVISGKVTAIGVSNFNVELTRYAHDRFAKNGVPLASNQVGYSLLHRWPEDIGLLELCKELNIAVLALLPLYEGVLTGKYRDPKAEYPFILKLLFRIAQQDFSKQSSRKVRFAERFAKPRALQREKIEPIFKVMDEIGEDRGKTPAQIALNWLFTSHPHVIPIPGAKNGRQAQENAGSVGWELTVDERERLSEAERACR